jgi:hypothetical protein
VKEMNKENIIFREMKTSDKDIELENIKSNNIFAKIRDGLQKLQRN